LPYYLGEIDEVDGCAFWRAQRQLQIDE